MADFNFTKIIPIVVVLIVALAVVAPAVSAMTTKTETITEEHVFGNNPLDAYDDIIAQTTRGNMVMQLEGERGFLDTTGPTPVWTANANGDMVKESGDLTLLSYRVIMAPGASVYLYTDSEWFETTVSQYAGQFEYNSEFHQFGEEFAPSGILLEHVPISVEDERYQGACSLTGISGGAYSGGELYFPFSVTYTQIVEDAHLNTPKTTTVTFDRGTITNNTFTVDANGDYIRIPLAITPDKWNATAYIGVGQAVYSSIGTGPWSSAQVTQYWAGSGANVGGVIIACDQGTGLIPIEYISPYGDDYGTYYPVLSYIYIPATANDGTNTRVNTVASGTITDMRMARSGSMLIENPRIGDYLCVLPWALQANNYYASNNFNSSTYFIGGNAMNTNSVPLADLGYFPVPQDGGFDITFTLSETSSLGENLYELTANSLLDQVFYIPYDAMTNDYAPYTSENYPIIQNEYGDFVEDPNGEWLKVTADAARSQTFYATEPFYVPTEMSWMLQRALPGGDEGEGDEPPEGGELPEGFTFTEVQVDEDQYAFKLSVTQNADGFIVIPREVVEAEGMDTVWYTNPDVSISTEYVPVRGNVVNNTFTPNESGDYLRIDGVQAKHDSYKIAKGQTYGYGSEITVWNEAPATEGIIGATFTFTEVASDTNVYDIGASMPDSGYLFVPYEISYEATEKVTTGLIPMGGLLVMVIILVSLVLTVSLLTGRRDF